MLDAENLYTNQSEIQADGYNIKPTTTLYDLYGVPVQVWFKKLCKFMNTPVGNLFSVIAGMFAIKKETPIVDTRRYFASSRRRLGMRGYGRYTDMPIMIMNELYNIEVEDLVKDRLRPEPFFIMGSREEIMEYIKNVSNADFDQAKDFDYYREVKVNQYVDDFIRITPNVQHVFRHWLQTQVNNGVIWGIDGYIFKDIPTTNMPGIASFTKKNCEVSDFLYKYYDSFQLAHRLKLIEDDYHYNVESFAKELMGNIMKFQMGTSSVDSVDKLFVNINTMLRDHDDHSGINAKHFTVSGESNIKALPN